MSRARVLVLLALVPLAGCAEAPEGPRLAQPTDEPAVVPVRPNDTTPDPSRPDYADAGYGPPAPWSTGDAWEWESATRWRQLRVEDAVTKDARVLLRVVQTEGPLGPGPLTRISWDVDASNWTRLLQTGLENAQNLTFTPPAPGLRAHKNESFRYVETSPTGTTNVSTLLLYKGPARGSAAWGEVPAARIEETTRRVGEMTRTDRIVRFASHEYGHDVSVQSEGETFRLVAVDHAGILRGVFRG